MQAFAGDYQPFPSGIRVALPISAEDAIYDEALGARGDRESVDTVGLVPLPADQRGSGVTVSGKVLGAEPGGTFVIAEGPKVAPYGVADSAGAYTLFTVKAGSVTLRGYRRGLNIKS